MCRIDPKYSFLVTYNELDLKQNHGVFSGNISGVFNIAADCFKNFRMKSLIRAKLKNVK